MSEGRPEYAIRLAHGDWVCLLRANGVEVLDLVELYADARTPDHTYDAFSRGCAKQWPWEEVCHARKRG